MFRIFISYNSENRDIVKTLAEDIETLGHRVWLDQELTGGQAWWDQILAEIRECHVLVSALSPEALDSHACRLEHEYAHSLGKPVLPIIVSDGVSAGLLPPALSKLQFVDYRRQDRKAAFALAKTFSNIPPPPPLPAVLPDAPDVPISYLGELKDQIDGASPLSFDAQTALVLKLKEKVRQKTDAKDGRQLLERLRKRPDLFALVATEIDDALAGHAGSSTEPRSPARAPRNEPTVPAPAQRAQGAGDTDRETEVSARDIRVDTGRDEVVGLLRRVLKTRERWTFVALPLRHVSVTSEERTITADAVFSDVAEIFGGAGNRLKTLGWQKSTARTAAQIVTAIAGGLSIGTLWLNRNVREFTVTNVMSRSWQVPSPESEQLVHIANEILEALRIIAPKHRTVTARRERG